MYISLDQTQFKPCTPFSVFTFLRPTEKNLCIRRLLVVVCKIGQTTLLVTEKKKKNGDRGDQSGRATKSGQDKQALGDTVSFSSGKIHTCHAFV